MGGPFAARCLPGLDDLFRMSPVGFGRLFGFCSIVRGVGMLHSSQLHYFLAFNIAQEGIPPA